VSSERADTPAAAWRSWQDGHIWSHMQQVMVQGGEEVEYKYVVESQQPQQVLWCQGKVRYSVPACSALGVGGDADAAAAPVVAAVATAGGSNGSSGAGRTAGAAAVAVVAVVAAVAAVVGMAAAAASVAAVRSPRMVECLAPCHAH
jgi:hypothetical protein